MRTQFGIVAAAMFSVSCVAADVAPSGCPVLESRCHSDGRMLVIGDYADSDALLTVMMKASDRFEQQFGHAPAATVVVPGGSISQEQKRLFREAGYAVHLPWLTQADKLRMKESTVRKQIKEQTKDKPAVVQEAILKQAMDALVSQGAGLEPDAVHDGALAHELGHLWFIDMYQSDNPENHNGHAYGGFAPDWLDETFAVLMETSELKARRREAFAAMTTDAIVPLSTFLSMPHPAAEAAQNLQNVLPADGQTAGSRVIVLTSEEANEFLAQAGGDRAAQFYAQVQVFSDFMIARSGTTQVYVVLTDWLQDGGDMASWLAAQGAAYNLPASIDALEVEWLEWLDDL